MWEQHKRLACTQGSLPTTHAMECLRQVHTNYETECVWKLEKLQVCQRVLTKPAAAAKQPWLKA